MKRTILFIVALFCFANIEAQVGYYYGTKFIELKPDYSKGLFAMRANSKDLLSRETASQYVSRTYYADSSGPIIILPKIIIKLENNLAIGNIITKYIDIFSLSEQYQNIYYLDCNVNTSEEVLSLVGQLSKEAGVIWCEPDMNSGTLTSTCNTNPLYDSQYYLKNYGYMGKAGIDINVEPAWDMVTGKSNITVAVIDTGVDLEHEDLKDAITPGYTVDNSTGYGAPQNWSNGDKAHGTMCAGVIGACDNTLGIKGVAAGIKILPVNIVPYYKADGNNGFAPNSEKAKAIRWAYPKSDVISCSWTCGTETNDIKEAINEARSKGRNGNGCVFVFSTGNDGAAISFPARHNGVIAVGAIDEYGIVTNYSNQGDEITLVAPGENIRTTTTNDLLGKYTYFSGTSAACPQVAGVAALILSARPNLKESEVKDILEDTARELSNWRWDQAYGYGLVDAGKAVAYTYFKDMYIAGRNIVEDNESYSVENLPDGCKVHWSQENRSSTLSSLAYLEPNTPNENVVTVNNLHGFSISLIATIEFPGGIFYRLSHNISGPTKSFSGFYTEISTIDGSKTLEMPLIADIDGETNLAIPYNDVLVSSDCFYGRKITYKYSDANPTNEHYINVLGDHFTFEMPYLEKGQTLDFTVWYVDKAMPLYTFKFRANVAYPQNSMNIELIGHAKYKVCINSNNEPQSKVSLCKTYTITVTNIQEKRTILYESHDINNYVLDLSDYKKGTYIIQVSDGKSSYSKKIFNY